jgi:hypothetical protein
MISYMALSNPGAVAAFKRTRLDCRCPIQVFCAICFVVTGQGSRQLNVIFFILEIQVLAPI